MPEIKDQPCPFCGEKKCTLMEEEIDIPHFGRVFVFSMDCTACGTRKSDVEPAEKKEPCKYTLEVNSEEDMNIKIVKSGQATVKIPRIITIEPGPASSGYITNVEGLIERVKTAIESSIEGEEDKLLPKIDSMEMYHEIKGAEIDFVPKGKHFVNIQNPKLVDKYIFNFLSKHSLKPGPIKE